jgi:hypothetical protein
MKNEILNYLNEPGQLEKMYRTDKVLFKREFSQVYANVKGNSLADFWNERLNYENDDINWGTRRELLFVIIVSLFAGVIAKLPALLAISEDFFYPRNIGFIVFLPLVTYFGWKNKLPINKIAFIVGLTLVALLFINFLPNVKKSDTLILSCIHLVLFLWVLLGIAFIGPNQNEHEKRLSYLKYNGDLVVITALIVIAGGIMTGITIGLFSLIGFHIQKFWFENVVLFGLPAAPVLGTYLTQTNPQLVGKVSPVIAKIFSPLVLIMLAIYLIAMVYTGKNPYNDREFLLIFNALLIGVMAIVFFSVSEAAKTKSRIEVWVLFLLSTITIIVNGIALVAVILRMSQWGITPNRAAVLGGDVLILINLLLVTAKLFKALLKKEEMTGVGKAIAGYLPLYFAWTVIVTFLFPFVFGFK